MSGLLTAMVGVVKSSAVARTARTITTQGNAQVDTAQSKFGGASGLFDATGDRLDIGSHSSLAFGTGDFTCECFLRFASRSGNQTIIDFRPGANGYHVHTGHTDGAPYLFINGSNVIYNDTSFNANNVFFHWALVRSSGTMKIYVNGSQITGSYNDSQNYTASAPSIGEINSAWSLTGYGINGHIDEFRISNTARYTTTFTPTTTPFVPDVNTLLLLHMDGTDASTTFTDDHEILVPSFSVPTAAFTDDSNTKLLLHFNGTNGATSTTDDNSSGRTAKTMTMTTSSLATAQKQFGSASLRVDGTGGDRVTCPDSGDWDLQSAPRTFEAFVRITSFTNVSRNSPNHLPKLFGHMDQGGNALYWAFGPNIDGGVSLFYWSGGNNFLSSTRKDLTTDVFYHMALIITSAGAKGYVDGIEYLSSPLSNVPQVGNDAFAIGSEYGQSMNAHIDEVRVSHVNRYT